MNNILVCQDRHLYPDAKTVGTVGERCAESLHFIFSENLKEFNRQLVFKTPNGGFNFALNSDIFSLPYEILTHTTLSMQLILTDSDNIITWKSKPYEFELNPSLDASGVNIISTAKAEQQQADHDDVAQSLNTLTGADFSDLNWQGLNDTIAGIPMKTTEEQNDIDDYSLIKVYAETVTVPHSQLWNGNGISVPFDLPYLNTKNVVWDGNSSRISNNLRDCGFDLSKGVIINGTNRMFFNGSTGLQNIRNVKLTGLSAHNNFNRLFYDCQNLKSLEMHGISNRADLASDAYDRTWQNCYMLESLLGDELDFTNIVATNTFYNCSFLKDIRFKSNSISCNLSLASSGYLTKDSTLSLINGLVADSGITVSLHNWTKNSCDTAWFAKFDNESELWVACERDDDDGVSFTTIISGNGENQKNCSIG